MVVVDVEGAVVVVVVVDMGVVVGEWPHWMWTKRWVRSLRGKENLQSRVECVRLWELPRLLM